MRPCVRRHGILPRSLVLGCLPLFVAACDTSSSSSQEWMPTPATTGQDPAWMAPQAQDPLGANGTTSTPDASAPGETNGSPTQVDAAIPTNTGDPGPSDAGLDAAVVDPSVDADAQADAGDPVDTGDAEWDGGADAAPDAAEPPATTLGEGGTVNATIIVERGEIYDGQNKRFRAGPAVGDGSQSEGQKPVFRLEDGATLRNVVLGAPAADGIHTYGDVTLENIVWEDVGEDALTIKESGTVVLDGGSATRGEDKIFQVNAPSTFRISNFESSYGGKFIRQNGGTSFRVDVYIDRCDISHMNESIFRTDSRTSSVTMTNTRYSAIGKELFMGVGSSNITLRDNTEY